MHLQKKLAHVSDECVACGCCEKTCPLNAITVFKGIYALVNPEKCIGCGKCQKVCPASVISIVERRNVPVAEKGGIYGEYGKTY